MNGTKSLIPSTARVLDIEVLKIFTNIIFLTSVCVYFSTTHVLTPTKVVTTNETEKEYFLNSSEWVIEGKVTFGFYYFYS